MTFKGTTANLLLFILCFGLLTPFAAASKEQHHDWIHVTPKDYPTVEQFFLKNDCHFTFIVAHFYDFDNEKWLSHSDIAEKFPQATGLLAAEECQSDISRENVSEVFNIDIAELEGVALIYIGPHEGFFDVFFTPGSRYRVIFDEQQPVLDSLVNIPRYWVTTPLTGIQNQ